MASYMSELDWLAHPVTNHVLSAELHNQSVNSMALLSARRTEEAVTLLQQMIANILCALVQAIDLRWLQKQTQESFREFVKEYHSHCSHDHELKWYDVVLSKGLADKNGFTKLEPLEKLRSLASRGSFCDLVSEQLGQGNTSILIIRPTLIVFIPHRQL